MTTTTPPRATTGAPSPAVGGNTLLAKLLGSIAPPATTRPRMPLFEDTPLGRKRAPDNDLFDALRYGVLKGGTSHGPGVKPAATLPRHADVTLSEPWDRHVLARNLAHEVADFKRFLIMKGRAAGVSPQLPATAAERWRRMMAAILTLEAPAPSGMRDDGDGNGYARRHSMDAQRQAMRAYFDIGNTDTDAFAMHLFTAPPEPATPPPSGCPVVRLTVSAHPDRRSLAVARFTGGRVVVAAGLLRSGDLAVFLPAGTLLPDWLLKALGRWDRSKGAGALRGVNGNRVFAARVGGVVSHGLLYQVRPPVAPGASPCVVVWDGTAPHGYNIRSVVEGQCAAAILDATPPAAA